MSEYLDTTHVESEPEVDDSTDTCAFPKQDEIAQRTHEIKMKNMCELSNTSHTVLTAGIRDVDSIQGGRRLFNLLKDKW